MTGTEPTTSYIQPPLPPPTPGIFGTKIPSTVAFAVGILLFLLPFAKVKCNGMELASNTGLGIVMGNDWSTSNMPNKGFMEGATKTVDTGQKQDPNTYAIIALALGVIGLGLSLTNVRSAMGSALVSGILSAGSLIGLMIDLKKKVKEPMTDKIDNTLGDNMKMVLEFTPWFYISVVAFLVAAFFCYKRIQQSR